MKPCPFCGVPLVPGMAANGVDVSYWGHPVQKDHNKSCYLSGVSVGAALQEKWDRRACGGFFMQVLGEGAQQFPSFNDKGLGKPVTIEMVNLTIQYYRSLANQPAE